jgi:hypothetical protein
MTTCWREHGIWPKSSHHRKTTWGKSTWPYPGFYGKEKYFESRYPHYKGRRKREVGVWYTLPQNAWRCSSTVRVIIERRMGRWLLIGLKGGDYRSRQRIPHTSGGPNHSGISTPIRHGFGVSCHKRNGRVHTVIQKTAVHDDTHYHES